MASDRHILLVEDNPDDEALTLRALNGHRRSGAVTVAHDGVEALDYLFGEGKFSNRGSLRLPAVVLLDLKLPRIDGLEVLRRIRANERTSLLPVVILTVSRSDHDIGEAYRLGANSYIIKPMDLARLTSAIAQICNYWLDLNRPADTNPR